MELQVIRKAITEEIAKLQKVLTALDIGTAKAKPRHILSKAARAKISAAQKKRWREARKAA